MTDPETAAAVEALTHRLRNKGDEDPEVFALEFITALRGRGWRHVSVLTGPPPAHEAGAGLPTRDDAVAAVAELRARLAGVHRGDDEGSAA